MFNATIIIAGCWDEETIELRGMPKDFILSARTLVVLEEDELKQLQAENERLRDALLNIKTYEIGGDIDYIIKQALELEGDK